MHIPPMFTYSHQGQLLPSVHLSYPYISEDTGNIPSMDCLSHCAFSFHKSEGTVHSHNIGWFNTEKKLASMSFPP